MGHAIRIIGALWPFDIILNSICCILMFKFTNFMIWPCFGKKCDRCCCIKYLGCCDCVFIGKCCSCYEDDESNSEPNKIEMAQYHNQNKATQALQVNFSATSKDTASAIV